MKGEKNNKIKKMGMWLEKTIYNRWYKNSK